MSPTEATLPEVSSSYRGEGIQKPNTLFGSARNFLRDYLLRMRIIEGFLPEAYLRRIGYPLRVLCSEIALVSVTRAMSFPYGFLRYSRYRPVFQTFFVY